MITKKATAYNSPNLATPSMVWLGVKITDVSTFPSFMATDTSGDDSLIYLSGSDRMKALAMLKRDELSEFSECRWVVLDDFAETRANFFKPNGKGVN